MSGEIVTARHDAAPSSDEAAGGPPYRDAGRSVDERARDLLGRMTLDEKVAQLGSVWTFDLVDGDRLD